MDSILRESFGGYGFFVVLSSFITQMLGRKIIHGNRGQIANSDENPLVDILDACIIKQAFLLFTLYSDTNVIYYCNVIWSVLFVLIINLFFCIAIVLENWKNCKNYMYSFQKWDDFDMSYSVNTKICNFVIEVTRKGNE